MAVRINPSRENNPPHWKSSSRRRAGNTAASGVLAAFLSTVFATPALAHASSQTFVLLLPTDFYIGSGVAAVVLTIVLLVSRTLGHQLAKFPSFEISAAPRESWSKWTSLASALILLCLIFVGQTGSRDPLSNLLPLSIWTLWWVMIVVLQSVFGNIWHWINPWSGPLELLSGSSEGEPVIKLPESAGIAPAIIGFLLFMIFMLAHPAPEDPATLAFYVGGYFIVSMIGGWLFGVDVWMKRCDCFSIMLTYLGRCGIFGVHDNKLRAGIPGWQLISQKTPSLTAAAFILFMLASSSFDGLNETFWWLVVLDINPLEFPGRSGIIWQTIIGVVFANLLLVMIFAACIFAGLSLIKTDDKFLPTFCIFAASVLPIAVGYHIAHFLPSFLVNSQYLLAAASDPLTNGSDILGLGTFYVTTGFFNTRETVRVIFLTQVFAVVIGHIVSILVAHRTATDLYGNNRQAVISQIPLAVFMVAYTFFGLWLLAAPRGA